MLALIRDGSQSECKPDCMGLVWNGAESLPHQLPVNSVGEIVYEEALLKWLLYT